jgi:predicted DNA-binding protein (UPF0251 family)
MARRRCCGKVDEEPGCRRFLPEGGEAAGVTRVSLEEFEAIRLKDMEGLDQCGCAAAMGLSRPTFQRILRSARLKVATALVSGRQIIFEGGSYMMKNRIFECIDCGQRWEEPPCTADGRHGYEIACPKCGGMNKMKVAADGSSTMCGGGQHGHGHGCCGGH